MSCRVLLLSCFVLLAASPCVHLFGADFRIETKVFSGDETSPQFENVTISQRGIVYDFLGGPLLSDSIAEVTIYDPRGRHFTLLDVNRQVKTRIQEDALLQFVAEVKIRALQTGAALAREAAQPNFRAKFDQQLRQLSLTGDRYSYVAMAGSERFPNAQTSAEYFNFIDMYARLNATRVGAMPPQARLELNRQLAEHELLPASIERTIRSRNPLLGKSKVVRSEHAMVWRLLRQDQKWIDKAAKQRAEFPCV